MPQTSRRLFSNPRPRQKNTRGLGRRLLRKHTPSWLRPSIFLRLPLELRLQIYSLCTLMTLLQLSQTCYALRLDINNPNHHLLTPESGHLESTKNTTTPGPVDWSYHPDSGYHLRPKHTKEPLPTLTEEFRSIRLTVSRIGFVTNPVDALFFWDYYRPPRWACQDLLGVVCRLCYICSRELVGGSGGARLEELRGRAMREGYRPGCCCRSEVWRRVPGKAGGR
ncbi:hypothetical protein BJ508DRAFT_323714 [Ascobolus immersus RN42]|uniref:F-box domain-containing protein n=1 Tax=Ascobolus immersus RN42 TaxID=1160509 RepID=A0A3N4IJY5_ASCIM|nr:hypothetical protein BJ508DRAFT_323714 [Ascobolus immersus RN42]